MSIKPIGKQVVDRSRLDTTDIIPYTRLSKYRINHRIPAVVEARLCSMFVLCSRVYDGSVSLSVSSGLGPPSLNQRRRRSLRRSSCALSWLRVSFFFFFKTSFTPPASSAPLPTGVAAVDAAGVWRRDRTGVFFPLPLGVSNVSSTTADLPW